MNLSGIIVVKMIYLLNVSKPMKTKITRCVFYGHRMLVSNDNPHERYKRCLIKYKVNQ